MSARPAAGPSRIAIRHSGSPRARVPLYSSSTTHRWTTSVFKGFRILFDRTYLDTYTPAMSEKKRSLAAMKAAKTRKLRAAGKKAAVTRRPKTSARKAAATRRLRTKQTGQAAVAGLRNSLSAREIEEMKKELDRM
jgi:hypothetical protein